MDLMAHLPVYAVIVPLLAAPVCVLLGRSLGAWITALGAAVVSFWAAVMLLMQVQATGSVVYELGGWAGPVGIVYAVDLLGAYVLLFVTGIAALVIASGRQSVESEVGEAQQPAFYAALLLAHAGLAGIIVTGDAFNVFVFLEVSSLASYALISMGRDRRALTSAFQYLVMGTIGATFILLGIGFMYMMTGTLNMQDLAERLPAVADTSTVRVSFAFVTIGIGLKLALFPLHLWLPNAYAYAPSVVTTLLAATATKVAVYAMVRFVYGIYGAGFAFGQMGLDHVLLPLAAVAVLSASVVAIFQEDVKRQLAYSSIAQIGYKLMGIGMASKAGLVAALVHLFNHALMKGLLFMALAAVMYRIGSVHLRDLAGIGQRMPWTTAAFVAGGMSLIGIPLTAGFISKWYLVMAALEQGWWWLIVVIMVGSLLAFVYTWRVVEIFYFRKPPETALPVREAPVSLLAPMWLLVLANLWFGINTEITVGVSEGAAAALFGGGS